MQEIISHTMTNTKIVLGTIGLRCRSLMHRTACLCFPYHLTQRSNPTSASIVIIGLKTAEWHGCNIVFIAYFNILGQTNKSDKTVSHSHKTCLLKHTLLHNSDSIMITCLWITPNYPGCRQRHRQRKSSPEQTRDLMRETWKCPPLVWHKTFWKLYQRFEWCNPDQTKSLLSEIFIDRACSSFPQRLWNVRVDTKSWSWRNIAQYKWKVAYLMCHGIPLDIQSCWEFLSFRICLHKSNYGTVKEVSFVSYISSSGG